MNPQQIRLSLVVAIFAAVASAVGFAGIVKVKLVPALSYTSSIAGTTTTATDSLSSEGQQKFRAKMTGDKEVPPVNTDTTGTISLAVTTNSKQQQNALDYDLTITNLNGAIAGADVQIGKQGVNGPIVADLNIPNTSMASAGSASTTTSNSISGTITSADFKGPLEGKQISDLIKLIEEGRAYANVNTEQYPDGEVRGQLLPSSTSAPSSAHTTSTDNTISALASTSTSESPSASASATATP